METVNKSPQDKVAHSSDTTIFYHPDGYDTSGAKLMGRHAAGEGFLKGWMTYGGANPISLWTKTEQQAAHGGKLLLDWGWLGTTQRSGPDNVSHLRKTGNLFLPGPGLADEAWVRHWHGDAAWSLCGITHTTASHRALDEIAGLLRAPVQPWDALICTSKAVSDTVNALFDREEDWFKHRLGATKTPRPKTPIIPLGVHTDFFERDNDIRAKWRADLAIAPETVCVLWMGRLSFHAKAHPAPLFQALEAATQQSGVKVCLVLAGWFAGEAHKAVFESGAARLAPSVELRFVDARPLDARKAVWSIGDIFALPSDNIQETFGLAPVEAMAAGLPVVSTDWNGFRDTVSDGEHGFLVPTFQPQAGHGDMLAYAHEADIISYDHYIGAAAQHSGFDIGAMAQAFAKLLTNPDLRAKMGAAGQAYAKSTFDWRHVIARYKELFLELGDIRRTLGTNANHVWPKQRPARQDPFALFSTYPTHKVTGQTWVEACDYGPNPQQAVMALFQSAGGVVWAQTMLGPPQLGELLARISQGGRQRLCDLTEALPAGVRASGLNGMAWLAKHGLVKLSWDPGK